MIDRTQNNRLPLGAASAKADATRTPTTEPQTLGLLSFAGFNQTYGGLLFPMDNRLNSVE